MGNTRETAGQVANLSELESALGHTFAKMDLLACALTHRSAANERSRTVALDACAEPAAMDCDNERLEFLGDAVLGLVVAEAIFSSHPECNEGEMTRLRSLLVSRQHMAQVARQIGLGDYLRLSSGEERSGLRNKSTVLSNTMEAVMGALFLDGGLDPVRAFVHREVMARDAERLAVELRSGDALGNYKSALQERLQAARAGVPVYRVKSESGPDHRKRFFVEVRVKRADGEPGAPLARGAGSTKKLAEQDAARRALERIAAGELDPSSAEAAHAGEGEAEPEEQVAP